MEREARRVGLRWKIGGTYTAVMLILSLLVIGATYYLTQGILRNQLAKRALAITNNLSDAAAGHIVGGNPLALNALANKYALLDGVAYVFIENNRGEVIAHTLGVFPEELREARPVGGQREATRRRLSLQGKGVYETGFPVLDGQVGRVHVGFWEDALENEIQNALLRLIGIIAILPVAGTLLSFLVAHWIVRPIIGLTEVADKVTRGDLELSVSTECVSLRDEIGDLARSLERMRSSLKAAMLRLNRETA
ncbi:MAG: HAMP domain-containing protein [Deltaproteobacteria bacterium]|jgi:two-component system, cell cycle sensor histidine kinase and response regulator CckA